MGNHQQQQIVPYSRLARTSEQNARYTAKKKFPLYHESHQSYLLLRLRSGRAQWVENRYASEKEVASNLFFTVIATPNRESPHRMCRYRIASARYLTQISRPKINKPPPANPRPKSASVPEFSKLSPPNLNAYTSSFEPRKPTFHPHFKLLSELSDPSEDLFLEGE
jgi:hypothetical protein